MLYLPSSLNFQCAARRSAVEIGVLDEKCSSTWSSRRWHLQREVDDAEPGGLLDDHGDIARTRDAVGHAGVEAGLRKQADVRGGGAAGGPDQRYGISSQVAGVCG